MDMCLLMEQGPIWACVFKGVQTGIGIHLEERAAVELGLHIGLDMGPWLGFLDWAQPFCPKIAF